MRATLAYSRGSPSWCSIIKPLSNWEAELFAATPKILSEIVTDSELRMVVLPLNVILPKNSASEAEITYLPDDFSIYTGDFSKKPSLSTMGTYFFRGSTRSATEMFPPTMAFEDVTILVVEFVNVMMFDVVFPAAETCSRVWSWVRRFEGSIFLKSLFTSLT